MRHLPPCGGGWEGGVDRREGRAWDSPHPNPPREGEGAASCLETPLHHQIFQPENRVAILPVKLWCFTRLKPAPDSMDEKRAGSGNLRIDSTKY